MPVTVIDKGHKLKFEDLPVVWGGGDPFTHTLCIGPTRCGKSALIIQRLIYQLLLLKKKGYQLGLSVIEPKGDIARFTRELCEEMGIEDFVHVDPLREDSHKINVMEGDINVVAEATVVVLKGLFGKQEQFFATVQELSARNVTKLLKTIHGDKLDITDLVNTLRDEKKMEDAVAELKRRFPGNDLINFFDNELLGSNKEKYRQFVMGLRAQLENLISNDKLRRILTGKSDLDLSTHYERGGVLAVNTALGELGTASDAFGQFTMMHLQRAAFRRPGTEQTRVPHFLIVDEASRYVNSEVEVFLAIGAEYRVAGFFALQSEGQLEVESGKLNARAMKRAFITSCRNRIIFGGLSSEDAKDLAEELGKDPILLRQNTYKNNILLPNLFPNSYRDTETEEYRFSPTDLKDGIPKFHFIYQLQKDGQPMPPRLAKGIFVPRNWKELREWEKPTVEEKRELYRLKVKSIAKQVVAAVKKTDQTIQQLDNQTSKEGSKELSKDDSPKLSESVTTKVQKSVQIVPKVTVYSNEEELLQDWGEPETESREENEESQEQTVTEPLSTEEYILVSEGNRDHLTVPEEASEILKNTIMDALNKENQQESTVQNQDSSPKQERVQKHVAGVDSEKIGSWF